MMFYELRILYENKIINVAEFCKLVKNEKVTKIILEKQSTSLYHCFLFTCSHKNGDFEDIFNFYMEIKEVFKYPRLFKFNTLEKFENEKNILC
jgi:hypothetical protein